MPLLAEAEVRRGGDLSQNLFIILRSFYNIRIVSYFKVVTLLLYQQRKLYRYGHVDNERKNECSCVLIAFYVTMSK